MGRHNSSLKFQLHERMQNLVCFGQSKHIAKQEYKQYCKENNIKYNPTKTVGIHSINTYNSYKQTSEIFEKWLKTNTDIKRLDDVDKPTVINFLKERQDNGCSPYTVSKDMSALNKILNLDVTKKEADLIERSYKNVTRSRLSCEHDNKYNANNYSNQIAVAQAFGLRRESIYGGEYQLKDISLYKTSSGNIRACVIEKGGRYREAPCLKQYEDRINELYPNIRTIDIKDTEVAFNKQEFKDLYNSSSSSNLFNEYTTKIDNHAFRGQYADRLYDELIRGQNIVPGYSEQYNDSGIIKGYDKAICRQVSMALGHNRISVVTQHYLGQH